jgi:hypothetical protein
MVQRTPLQPARFQINATGADFFSSRRNGRPLPARFRHAQERVLFDYKGEFYSKQCRHALIGQKPQHSIVPTGSSGRGWRCHDGIRQNGAQTWSGTTFEEEFHHAASQ